MNHFLGFFSTLMGSQTVSSPCSCSTWESLFRFLENFLGCTLECLCWTTCGWVSADFISNKCLCLRLRNLKLGREKSTTLTCLTFLLSDTKISYNYLTEFRPKGCLSSALQLPIYSCWIQPPIKKSIHIYSYHQKKNPKTFLTNPNKNTKFVFLVWF